MELNGIGEEWNEMSVFFIYNYLHLCLTTFFWEWYCFCCCCWNPSSIFHRFDDLTTFVLILRFYLPLLLFLFILCVLSTRRLTRDYCTVDDIPCRFFLLWMALTWFSQALSLSLFSFLFAAWYCTVLYCIVMIAKSRINYLSLHCAVLPALLM